TCTALRVRDGRSTDAAAYVLPSVSRTAAPSAAPTRARVARARVTSLASSALSGVSVIALLLVPLGGLVVHGGGIDEPHQHRTHLVASTRRALGLETQSVDLDHRAGQRNPAQVLGHQPT